MELIRKIERLELLIKLVKEQRTGSPDQFAQRLGMSRAKLYLVLEELRDEGVEIGFCKKVRSFCFKSGEITFKFSWEIVTDEELQNLDGGFGKIQPFNVFGINYVFYYIQKN
ncbi:DNA-binding protein [Belliella kenyensis]|uniref:DNA-binding protein n=1 Tax=Belliella kenyensis TaxID=1472724 RepID=A0ABV8EIA0_9BACT|nr:DNA-binding protein [Belliella kenyensis]MCH7401288.1 DNA-binding protein [Belliella kenyensis]MDN3602733.1 DNA-binding protein [Belliella kenyensis]